MFDLVKLRPEHFECMIDQKSNQYLREWFRTGHAEKMAEEKSAFTGMVNGKPAVCGGITEFWRDRGFIWCVFNEDFKTNFLPVFRGIKRFLDDYPCRRLETAVPWNMRRAMERLELMGFVVETPIARKFLADGTDCVLYVRLK